MERILRCTFVVVLAITVSGAGAEEAAPGSVRALECVPPAAVLVPPGVDGIDQPPVAVVETRVKPKRTRLYLDGRFIGLAEDFDGVPDYLYLRPGDYRVRAELEGFAPAYFDVSAAEGCLFDLRHSMVRIPGTKRDPWWGRKARPLPFHRVFGPLPRPEKKPELVMGRGADLRLRPELDLSERQGSLGETGPAATEMGRLKLMVEPSSASVALNGEFWIEARDLARLASPVAVPAGAHTLEVAAPGFVARTMSISVPANDVLELRVSLDAAPETP